jgi:hypothetical protein
MQYQFYRKGDLQIFLYLFWIELRAGVNYISLLQTEPATVAVRFKATVFARSNIGVVCSNPT